MRLVRNPSHKHSEEIIKKFNLLKDNIFYKDHTSYEPEQIKSLIKIVELCKSFGLKSESTKWISKQAVDLKLNEKAINDDYIPVLLGYQKYKNKGLKQLSEYVSVIELNYAIQEIVGETSEAISSEEFGIIDEHNGWLLTIPYTVEASCSLGSKTVWCTARRDHENRFFNYIFEDKVILFYALNLDKSVTKERKISIGFKDGILIEGSSGVSETVDENNNPLSEADLIRIFDRETYERFYKKMKEKLELINNEHPLITKIKLAKNNIKSFNKLTDQEKKEVLKLGDYSYEFESYIYEKYFGNAEKTIFLSDLLESFLSNVSGINIVNKLYENEHLMFKHKSYMFSSKHVPEFLRNEFRKHMHNIQDIRDLDFVLNIFSYINYDSLGDPEKEHFLNLVTAQSFDHPTIDNISFDEKIFDLAKNVRFFYDNSIFESISMRTFSKKVISIYINKVRKNDMRFLYHLARNRMFDEFKIELINAADISNETFYFFLDKVIAENKIKNEDYQQIRNNIVEFYMQFLVEKNPYDLPRVENIKKLILINEKDPFVKARFFTEHSDIDYFTDEELLFIINKKGKYDPFNKELMYSLFLRLHKLFPEEAVLSAINLCKHRGEIKNIRTDNKVLKEAVRKILREREDRKRRMLENHFEYLERIIRNTTVDKSLLMDLIRADIQQYIMYAKEIEGSALEFIFKNLDIFLNDKFLRPAVVELEDFMRSKNFKAEFLLEIDNRKIKNFYMHNGQNSLMMLASFEIFSYPASREAIISHAITQGITTEEEIQRIINSKKKSLDQMAKSKNLNDLLYVASQKNLTRSIIETLKASRRKEVLDALLDNPDIYLSDLF